MRQSIKISFNKGDYVRYGGIYRTITATWQYGWFGWPGSH